MIRRKKITNVKQNLLYRTKQQWTQTMEGRANAKDIQFTSDEACIKS